MNMHVCQTQNPNKSGKFVSYFYGDNITSAINTNFLKDRTKYWDTVTIIEHHQGQMTEHAEGFKLLVRSYESNYYL